jgi:SAM-dependent methyltransferase
MGVGLLRAPDALRVRWIGPLALVLLFGAVKYFANVVVQAPASRDEYVWGIFSEMNPHVRRVGIVPTAVLLFALVAALFVPLGALMGAEFRKYKPLVAYTLDVTGSLAGILAFAAASSMGLPPVAWFSFALAAWTLLSIGSPGFAATLAAASAGAVALTVWTGGPRPEYWSPYYRVNVYSLPGRYSVHVNGSFHQYMLDLDTARARTDPYTALVRLDYARPYGLAPRLDSVLVLGAGTGNDVAMLLEAGARYIDAVEIDPAILGLGGAGHFQRPYADPRVHLHNDDARAFLKRTRRRYSAIVLGTLDSQTLLSGMSSLRLDNYVYTVESFMAARDRLEPGGVLIMYHMSHEPYIAAKLNGMLAAAFGAAPLVWYEERFRLFNYTFVAGASLSPELEAAARGASPPPAAATDTAVALPHDDWPYLYLRRPTIPAHYRWALLGVLGVAAAMIALAVGRRPLRFDGAMFGMGAGFLLVETKSVTEMSLLFGSTWTVNVLVFSAILVVILAASLLTLRRPLRSPALGFALLFASLGVAWAVPVRELLWLGPTGQWMAGGLLVGLPIFFAARIFAQLFAGQAESAQALGSNLMGAVVGGVAEYLSMLLGVKALYVVAALFYLGALAFARRRSA